MNVWAEKFAESNLVKGQKGQFVSVLLSPADKVLLERAAAAAGLKPGVLASRIVSQVLRSNRHRYEGL